MELLFIVSPHQLAPERVEELQKRHKTKVVFVTKPALLKTVVSGEIWSEVFQRTTSAHDELSQAKAFTAIANPSHHFSQLKVKRDLKTNLYHVLADVVRRREFKPGSFGIRGSGVVIDGVRHFNNVISIDWVENPI